jgi:hypothetical protein
VAIIPTRSSLARITQIGFHRHHRQCRERERQQVHLQSGNRRENLSSPHVKMQTKFLIFKHELCHWILRGWRDLKWRDFRLFVWFCSVSV